MIKMLILSLIIFCTDIFCSVELKYNKIYIILGSTRQDRASSIFGNTIQKIANEQHPNIFFEVIDLKKFDLPFFDDEFAPLTRMRKGEPVSKNPKILAWSDKIKLANGFIFIVPEYNLTMPGVFKNALDLLYPEWNNKPVMLICYSGGPTGGISTATDLNKICKKLQMQVIPSHILINNIGGRKDAIDALDDKHFFKNKEITEKISQSLDELIKKLKLKSKL